MLVKINYYHKCHTPSIKTHWNNKETTFRFNPLRTGRPLFGQNRHFFIGRESFTMNLDMDKRGPAWGIVNQMHWDKNHNTLRASTRLWGLKNKQHIG